MRPSVRSKSGLYCSLATLLPLAIASPAHAAYNVTNVFDPTGSNFINLLGINNSGEIGGFVNQATSSGFTLTLPSSFTTVNFPGATTSMVTGLNAAGGLSGIYTDAAGNTHGFTRIGGTFATVDNPLSTVFNQALGINNSDETVGYYAPTPAGAPGQIAYSQAGGVFTDINHLLPGASTNMNSQAVGINNTGDIVGFYQQASGNTLGFEDADGSITTIDPFGSTNTQALGVNDSGEIVGFYTDANGFQHGYIDNGGVFTTFDPTGSVSTTINGLNNAGDIVGFYGNAAGDTVGFVGTPVPEPSTWAAMLAGFAALGLAGLRASRRSVAAA